MRGRTAVWLVVALLAAAAVAASAEEFDSEAAAEAELQSLADSQAEAELMAEANADADADVEAEADAEAEAEDESESESAAEGEYSPEDHYADQRRRYGLARVEREGWPRPLGRTLMDRGRKRFAKKPRAKRIVKLNTKPKKFGAVKVVTVGRNDPRAFPPKRLARTIPPPPPLPSAGPQDGRPTFVWDAVHPHGPTGGLMQTVNGRARYPVRPYRVKKPQTLSQLKRKEKGGKKLTRAERKALKLDIAPNQLPYPTIDRPMSKDDIHMHLPEFDTAERRRYRFKKFKPFVGGRLDRA